MKRKIGLSRSGAPALVAAALALSAALAGCDPAGPEVAGGGRFSLVYLEGMGDPAAGPVAAAIVDAPDAIALDLGDLKGSRDFYFLLQNSGDSAIEDVALTSSNDAFAVMPAAISVIEPAAGDGASLGLLPVVRVSVNHGTALEGIGFTDLLPPGENSAQIAIAGTTTAADSAAAVGLEVELTVDAQIMDLELYCDDALIELGAPDNTYGTEPYGGMAVLPGYYCNGVKRIFNAGTVDLSVQTYDWSTDAPLESQACAPGETITVSDLAVTQVIAVDGDNTVSDGTRHAIGNDGNIYFVIDETIDG